MTIEQERYNEIIKEVAGRLELPISIVNGAYRGYWLFIRNHISQLPLKENLSEEEYGKFRPNVNLPSLGKLSCNWDRYQRVKQRYEYIKKLKANENDKCKEN